MSLEIVQHPSPNFNERPNGRGVEMVVVHGTAGASAQADVQWLCDEATDAAGNQYDVSLSYHYVVGRDGHVWQLVDEDKRAWHAGESEWHGQPDVNDYSVGIGISNRGPVGGDARNPAAEEYTTPQILATGELIVRVCLRHSLPWRRVVSHAQVSPGRKHDPWLHFPWGELAGAMVAYNAVHGRNGD